MGCNRAYHEKTPISWTGCQSRCAQILLQLCEGFNNYYYQEHADQGDLKLPGKSLATVTELCNATANLKVTVSLDQRPVTWPT